MPVENPRFFVENSVENLGKTLVFWGKVLGLFFACGKPAYFFHRFSTGANAGTPDREKD